MLKSEGLIYYFRKMMHEATATTPRLPAWSDEEYFAACCRWSEEHGKAARDKGGDFHDQIQRFHAGMTPDFLADPMLRAYCDWYEAYVDKTIGTELVVMGDGYGGRLDHVCKLKDGRVAITDVKTQDISKRGTFNQYFEWSLQLGAYAGAINRFPGPAEGNVDVLVSICISSKPPFVVEAHYWPEPVAYYHDLFLGLLRVWKFANDYDC